MTEIHSLRSVQKCPICNKDPFFLYCDPNDIDPIGLARIECCIWAAGDSLEDARRHWDGVCAGARQVLARPEWVGRSQG